MLSGLDFVLIVLEYITSTKKRHTVSFKNLALNKPSQERIK
jgi:hypothetical protein